MRLSSVVSFEGRQPKGNHMKKTLIIAAVCLLGGAAYAASALQKMHEIFTQGLTLGQTGTQISDSFAASSTIDFASTTDQCTDSSAITVTGAAVNDVCLVGAPASGGAANAFFSCYVSAADAVKVRFCSHGAVDPASATFTVRVFDP